MFFGAKTGTFPTREETFRFRPESFQNGLKMSKRIPEKSEIFQRQPA
jgi:hypothetical protein